MVFLTISEAPFRKDIKRKNSPLFNTGRDLSVNPIFRFLDERNRRAFNFSWKYRKGVDPIAKLELGMIFATPEVLQVVPEEERLDALRRHASGDWGEVDEEDRLANDNALRTGERILSIYTSSNGKKFWIVTEADRSKTILLLPEDY
jgi:hypothetical protein